MIFVMPAVPLDLFLHFATMQRSWDGQSLLHSKKTSICGTLLCCAAGVAGPELHFPANLSAFLVKKS
jgi:hypothetical protein